MGFIMGNEYGAAVCRSLGVDESTVRRVVVDAEVGEIVKVHIEHLGTDALLTVTPPPDMKVFINGEEAA